MDPITGLTRRTSDLEVLHGLCHAFGSIGTVDEAIAALRSWLSTATDGGSVAVLVLDEDDTFGRAGTRFDDDAWQRMEAAVDSKEVAVRDIDADTAVGTFPMVSRGVTFGVVEVQAEPEILRAAHHLITSIVSQGAILLRSLRVQRELERELTLMRDLRDVEVRMASLAHELKGPIMSISHAIDSALKFGIPEGLPRTLLRDSKDELIELDNVIDHLLTSHLHVSETETFDLLALALEAMEDTKAEVDGHSLSLHGEPVEISANRTRLRIAVSNVIRNALRHSPPDSEVIVSVGGSESRAYVKIEDTGPGVRPEDVPTIFEPFQRGVRPRSSGVGLGLFITRTVLESHGGSVRVTSRSEGGACFTLEVPRAPDPIGERHAV